MRVAVCYLMGCFAAFWKAFTSECFAVMAVLEGFLVVGEIIAFITGWLVLLALHVIWRMSIRPHCRAVCCVTSCRIEEISAYSLSLECNTPRLERCVSVVRCKYGGVFYTPCS
jgi:hypothetical protein